MSTESVNNNRAQYNDKIITIKDREGNEQKVSLSVFLEGMAIAHDDVGVVSMFDTNKNKKIDAEEAEKIKKAIFESAGEDAILDDNEILSMLNIDLASNKAKNILNQFKIMVERQFKGTLKTSTTLKDGKTVVSDFNRDGSGTAIINLPNGQKITCTYSKGKVLEKSVTENPDGTTTTEEYTNQDGKPVKCIKKRNGKEVEKVGYKYDEKGRLVEQKNIVIGGKIKKGNVTVDTSKVTIATHEYYGDTNVRKKTVLKKPNFVTQTTEFNEDGKVAKNTVIANKVFITKNQNLELRATKTESVYTYNPDGGHTIVTHGVDMNGRKSESTFDYDKDNKPLRGNRTYYKRGAKVIENYDGNNLSNRIKGNIPSERIEYEEGDETKIKKRTIFKFDEDGIVIGDEIYDENSNKIGGHNYTELDHRFDTAYQVGRGDCYLLAAINALASTEEGTKLLNDSIKEEGGNYVVSFPGAAIAKSELIKKLKAKNPNFDVSGINIPDKYTITAEELHEAMKKAGSKYSWGDKDVLLLEVAYEKFRTAAAKCLSKNKIPSTEFISNLTFDPKYTSQGDFLSGGHESEVIFALTGRKAEKEFYVNKETFENMPTCYIDSNYQMHVTDSKGQLASASMSKSMPSEERSQDTKLRDEIINRLIKDCEDGKLDKYAATAAFKVSSQEVNGKTINGGGHAFSIKNITKDEVIIRNPWNPEVDVKMSMEDFKKAVTGIQIVSLKQNSGTVHNPAQPSQQTPTQPEPPNNPSAAPTGENEKNYTVKKGEGYTSIIIRELRSQGIETTVENIQKAKAQFEQRNPSAVHVYGENGRGKNKKYLGNKFLFANAIVYIPKFNIDSDGNVI